MANVFGTNAAETLNAFDGVTNGADTIFGFGGNDAIFGLGGNDLILGGAGADTINGGSGTDTASYTDSSEGVTVFLTSGQGTGGTAEGDTLESIENLTGSAHEDYLVGDDGNNVLTGLEDNDTLKGGGGSDILYGDSGNDKLKGGGGADTINGGSGVDTASYEGSSAGVFISLITDTADWGDATGDELNSIENLIGSAHDDQLWGNDGVNVISGGEGNDTLKGYGGADTLNGGDGIDHMEGGAGNDVMNGGAGNDTMIGGIGNDDYMVTGVGDIITEGAAEGDNDRVLSTGDYALTAANVESVVLLGSAIAATGNSQSNTLYGNAMGNFLNGAGGSDSLLGGGGNDTFFFQAGQAHGDTVYDFTGNGAAAGDILQFSGYGTAAAGASLVHLGGNDWQINSADGTIHETIVIVGAVDASDFIFA